jgi:acyl-coenzyme A thioesterase PaaI-like protein
MTSQSGVLQPNSSMCFICGMENPVGLKLRIYQIEPGIIETFYTAPDHFQGYPGILHGGIVATILDEICGRAHMGSSPRFMFTAKLEVKYRKNVPTGKIIKIIGKAGRSKGKLALSWAGIYDDNDILLAEANATLVDLPQEMVKPDQLAELGWKVYPE